jgi:hypothetical protein
LSVAADWLKASGNYFEDCATWLYDSAIYGVAALSFGRGANFERAAAAMLALVLVVAGCQGAWDSLSCVVCMSVLVAFALGASNPALSQAKQTAPEQIADSQPGASQAAPSYIEVRSAPHSSPLP